MVHHLTILMAAALHTGAKLVFERVSTARAIARKDSLSWRVQLCIGSAAFIITLYLRVYRTQFFETWLS